jgi:hypothetical protein
MQTIAVGVGTLRIGAVDAHLVCGRQSIAVIILITIKDPIGVGIDSKGVGLENIDLNAVAQPIAVGVSHAGVRFGHTQTDDLQQVDQSIGIWIFIAIGDAIVIGIRFEGVGQGQRDFRPIG